ncbi:MAG: hypothetical protein C4539_04925 [Ignavibacteriales bacterium]|nr:MAG: hypothetical protein C4539_04925 [Ignavibacteriales bacterium]
MAANADSSGNISKFKWVIISAGAFVLCLVAALLVIVFADKLNTFGLTKSFYFILLIPVSLGTAAFLFGALRSYAKYSGNLAYGKLELSGPIVVFCLVIAGGFYFAKPESSFILTIRLFKDGDKSKIIKEGNLIADFGEQRVKKEIDENGEVIFAGISSGFIGKEINIIPGVEGYRLKNNSSLIIPDNRLIYLELEKKSDSTLVRGIVLDKDGNPLPKVNIDFENGLAESITDSKGRFVLSVPGSAGKSVLLTAELHGSIGYRDYVTIPENSSITVKFESRK